ncbi:helix-turn-helix transcriptional regulator [Amycolatopsis sp. SID8362]|nr:helix-turn-helix transcriptional regulator [Amycolatopsis sp. SID8362]NED43147.1 helix-turn-helix transcriptional regulator [Amycolatopsis sp. SID8362]
MFGESGALSAANGVIVPGIGGFLRTCDALEPVSAAVPRDVPPHLSECELQVLWGMASGQRNVQIGAELVLSEDSIKTHCKRIYRKLGVHDRAEAVAAGFRAGFLT